MCENFCILFLLYFYGSDNISEVADSFGSTDKLGQIWVRQGLMWALKATHRFGSNLIRQPNDTLGCVVRRINRISTNTTP